MSTSQEIRDYFISFFRDQCAHEHLPSSGLLPQGDEGDASLLFTNAGMVQFKSYFTEEQPPAYSRVVTCQKCLRAGGKHNDLDMIGRSNFHHTFFEMLGNFSFFDYGKAEAIDYAWRFVTRELRLPVARLYTTFLQGDDETQQLWGKIAGLPPERVLPMSKADNFWAMGDCGPCGPCSEIFFETGNEQMPALEVWNLVFMQYRQNLDGELSPLRATAIDTGMGLERISSILQGTYNNYATDLFQDIVKSLPRPVDEPTHDPEVAKLVICDHLRAIAFLIAEDLLPGNNGRNYVLRRLIRNAAYQASVFRNNGSLLARLVPVLVTTMGKVYPELVDKQQQIIEVVKAEEASAGKTLDTDNFWRAYHRIEAERHQYLVQDCAEQSLPRQDESIISGEVAFKLQDTYGFPLSLTKNLAQVAHMTVDEDGFNVCMQEQRERSKQHSKFTGKSLSRDYAPLLVENEATDFVGYRQTESKGIPVQAIFIDQTKKTRLRPGQAGCLVFGRTPFYAVAGGQISDQGYIVTEQGGRFKVEDVQKVADVYLHFGSLESGSSDIQVGNRADLCVDRTRRSAIIANHTATHLLNQALRQLFGNQVKQQGSFVGQDHLRFDFNHPHPLSAAQLATLEDHLERVIKQDLPVSTTVMSLTEAKRSGAQAVFNERYGSQVRVVRVGDATSPASLEICGGIHVASTRDIRFFKITKSKAIAAGIRRIEAVTKHVAADYLHRQSMIVDKLTAKLQTSSEQLVERVDRLAADHEQTLRRLENLQLTSALHSAYITEQISTGKDKKLQLKVVATDLNPKLQQAVLKSLLQQAPGIYLCHSDPQDEQVNLSLAVSDDLLPTLDASLLWQELLTLCPGKGGGKKGFARGIVQLPRKQRIATFTSWSKKVINKFSKD